MPTPDRTSLDAIVAAARDILEADGLAGLTMQRVALAVGVRAPSLYKRVLNRDELIRLVAESSFAELAERLDAAADLADGATRFRAFGHERPAAFRLILAPGVGVPVAGVEHSAAASATVIRLAGQLAGERHALDAARTLTAWAAGFVLMELGGGFALGGDVETAWAFGLDAVVGSLTPRS